jgi:methylenetetrahydrofolate dehydrogenase (NADP+)/methenyltetrahydrofolate cyclohydrolase
VAAIAEICTRYNIALKKKSVAVVGRGELVGGPAVTWLQNQDIEPQVYEKGDDLTGLGSADVIISGAGDPHVITPDIINKKVVLFDAGTSQSDGGVRGDVHPESYEKCRLITPVPGGIGPITVAKLFENLLTLIDQ